MDNFFKKNMNKEAALQLRVTSPDLLFISGSRLYGSNRPNSDEDFRGFTIPPYEYLIGTDTFKDTDVPGADHKVYALRRYLELVLKGDPQLTESLFIPKDKIVHCTSVGQRILDLRDDIVSNQIYARIMGYGYSEWRKAKGERLMVDDFTKTEDMIINDIRNVFEPDKDTMDEVIELLRQRKPRKVVPSKKDMGEKRRKEFEAYGFCVTSAAHAIRLMQQLKEVMETGTITFPRPNAKFLLDLRTGKYTLAEAEEVYNAARAETEAARDKSVLPNKPNKDKVWAEYMNIIVEYLETDLRFAEAGGFHREGVLA